MINSRETTSKPQRLLISRATYNKSCLLSANTEFALDICAAERTSSRIKWKVLRNLFSIGFLALCRWSGWTAPIQTAMTSTCRLFSQYTVLSTLTPNYWYERLDRFEMQCWGAQDTWKQETTGVVSNSIDNFERNALPWFKIEWLYLFSLRWWPSQSSSVANRGQRLYCAGISSTVVSGVDRLYKTASMPKDIEYNLSHTVWGNGRYMLQVPRTNVSP